MDIGLDFKIALWSFDRAMDDLVEAQVISAESAVYANLSNDIASMVELREHYDS